MSEPIRIIVFDDDRTALDEFRRVLEEWGCLIRTVDNARCEGIEELLAAFRPDFCIVDCEFEYRTDGVRIVKALQAAQAGLPVVMCSKFLDQQSERPAIVKKYRKLSGVCSLIGKKPFPAAHELIKGAGIRQRSLE